MQLSQYTTRDRLLATQCPPDNWGRIVRLGYTLLATRMVGHAYMNVNRPTSHVTSTVRGCWKTRRCFSGFVSEFVLHIMNWKRIGM